MIEHGLRVLAAERNQERGVHAASTSTNERRSNFA
jgi:hypothetical protein